MNDAEEAARANIRIASPVIDCLEFVALSVNPGKSERRLRGDDFTECSENAFIDDLQQVLTITAFYQGFGKYD